MRTLVIGGTRNLGPSLVAGLIDRGDTVSVLHRGQTAYAFPAQVEELFADRSDANQLRSVVGKRSFDLVVDTTLYNAPDAETTISLFTGRTAQYIVLSTGQVYLVRTNVSRPSSEGEYDGSTIAALPPEHPDFKPWSYGIHKRAAEDALFAAHRQAGFPVTVLRLPMVNSERDHFGRIANYLARMEDGGPILVPSGPHLNLRHIYGSDVVTAILRASRMSQSIGQAYNISQDETLSIDDFLSILGKLIGVTPQILRVSRQVLVEKGLMPHASPFSDPWMSELDNQKSKADLGMVYTPLTVYLKNLVNDYQAKGRRPEGYQQRPEERKLIENGQQPRCPTDREKEISPIIAGVNPLSRQQS